MFSQYKSRLNKTGEALTFSLTELVQDARFSNTAITDYYVLENVLVRILQRHPQNRIRTRGETFRKGQIKRRSFISFPWPGWAQPAVL
jgi:hypothetical protein